MAETTEIAKLSTLKTCLTEFDGTMPVRIKRNFYLNNNTYVSTVTLFNNNNLKVTYSEYDTINYKTAPHCKL